MEKIDVKDYLSFYSRGNEITRPKPVRIFVKNPKPIFKSFLEHTITNAEWLSEYDEICTWLSDNHNKGLMLFGMNGRGKTMIATKILPMFIDYYFFHRIWQNKRPNSLRTFNENLCSYESGQMKGDSRDIFEAENMDNSGKITSEKFLQGEQRRFIESLVRNISDPEKCRTDEYLRGYTQYLIQKVYTLETFLYHPKATNCIDPCGVLVDEHDKWPTKIVVFDDIGTEPEEFVIFGNRHRLFAEAVDYCEKTGILLIFTTNLTQKEITNRYGERVADRLRELVTPILFKGKSLRR